MRIWLNRINRHHSDRLAGPLTPFRRRDKPRLTLSRYLVFFIILRNASYFNRKKHRLFCVLLRLRRGNFSGWRDCRSLYHSDNGFVCSGGQGATVRVQSVTALTCPCRSKSSFPRRENCQQYAGALRCGVHSPHLHPRHPSKAGRSRTDHGQLHGAGDGS